MKNTTHPDSWTNQEIDNEIDSAREVMSGALARIRARDYKAAAGTLRHFSQVLEAKAIKLNQL